LGLEIILKKSRNVKAEGREGKGTRGTFLLEKQMCGDGKART
jgi:hypothetical protein